MIFAPVRSARAQLSCKRRQGSRLLLRALCAFLSLGKSKNISSKGKPPPIRFGPKGGSNRFSWQFKCGRSEERRVGSASKRAVSSESQEGGVGKIRQTSER